MFSICEDLCGQERGQNCGRVIDGLQNSTGDGGICMTCRTRVVAPGIHGRTCLGALASQQREPGPDGHFLHRAKKKGWLWIPEHSRSYHRFLKL